MKHLYVVTHGESTHHVENLVGGWYDSALTARGRRQAARIAERLRELVPADVSPALYSSDLARAYQTAEVISQQIGAPTLATVDFREKSYGEAGGKPQSWFDERFVRPPRTGDRMRHREGLPGAETRREFAERIYRGMDRVLSSSCSHQIIVTHGFALTFVVAAWIAMPIDSAGYINVRATSGGITYLLEDDVFSNRAIHRINDTSHLDPSET